MTETPTPAPEPVAPPVEAADTAPAAPETPPAPVESAEDAKARIVREALFGFLLDVGDRFSDQSHTAVMVPTELLIDYSDALMNAPCEAADSTGQKVMAAIADQIRGLPEVQPTKQVLLSRARPDTQWSQTAFFHQKDRDGKMKVFAKLGDEHGQPIALDVDGVHMHQYPSSRYLWVRDWAWAYVVPAIPPFRLDRKNVANEDLEKLYRVDPIKGKETMDMLAQAIEEFESANAKLDDEQKMLDLAGAKRSDNPAWNKTLELRDDILSVMRDTCKLAAIRLPALDRIHKDMRVKHSMKDIYLEANPAELARASSEYIRAVLNADAVKVDQATTELQPVPAATKSDIAQAMLDGLTAAMPPGVPSIDQLVQAQQVLSRASVVLPEVAALTSQCGVGAEEMISCVTAVRAVLSALITPKATEAKETA